MQNRTTAQEMIVVEINQVDLANRVAHVFDKTRAPIQVSFRQAPGGIFHVPFKGEMWTAKRIGVQWYLDQKLDSLADHLWAVENMEPGDTRVDAEGTLYINAGNGVLVNGLPLGGGTPTFDTFSSDPTAFTTVTLSHTPIEATIQVFLNGLLAQSDLWSLTGSDITFVPDMAYGYLNVYYSY